MKLRTPIIAAFISVAVLASGYAQEPVASRLAQSIPENVVFCVRLDLNVARNNREANGILDAAMRQFKERLDAIGQSSGLALTDVDGIWVGVVKDKEALVVLEGRFDAELILNSPVVANSRKLVRPGTLVAIEMNDEQKGEVSHGVVVNANIIAIGLPELVDKFVARYVGGESGWEKSGLSVMASLAASDAMLNVAVMQVPRGEIEQKPFLANFVNARLEMHPGEKVTATARIAMQDETRSTALRDLISGFVGLGLAGEIKTEYPEIRRAIVDGLKLSNEGKTVVLSSAIDTELLRKLLKAKGLELN